MDDLVCEEFFSQTSGERVFSTTLIFFEDFFPRNQSAEYFFF